MVAEFCTYSTFLQPVFKVHYTTHVAQIDNYLVFQHVQLPKLKKKNTKLTNKLQHKLRKT